MQTPPSTLSLLAIVANLKIKNYIPKFFLYFEGTTHRTSPSRRQSAATQILLSFFLLRRSLLQFVGSGSGHWRSAFDALPPSLLLFASSGTPYSYQRKVLFFFFLIFTHFRSPAGPTLPPSLLCFDVGFVCSWVCNVRK